MHVDLYTKSVLTIIAVCLLILVFREISSSALSQLSGSSPVMGI